MRASIVLAALIGLSGTAISEEDGYSHEQKTYRFGGTYKVIAATDVQSCANRCQLEDVCLAWSFQRETQGLGTARCELKSSVGRAEENALMVSGISPRLSGIGNAPPAGGDDSQLLGGTRASVTIPTLRPTITSANAKVSIIGDFDRSAPTTRSRLP